MISPAQSSQFCGSVLGVSSDYGSCGQQAQKVSGYGDSSLEADTIVQIRELLFVLDDKLNAANESARLWQENAAAQSRCRDEVQCSLDKTRAELEAVRQRLAQEEIARKGDLQWLLDQRLIESWEGDKKSEPVQQSRIPVTYVIDPTMPSDTIELRGANGSKVTITGVG